MSVASSRNASTPSGSGCPGRDRRATSRERDRGAAGEPTTPIPPSRSSRSPVSTSSSWPATVWPSPDLGRRVAHRGTADRGRAARVGAHAPAHEVRVAVQHVDLVDADVQLIARRSGRAIVVPLSARAGAGQDDHLAGRLHPHGRRSRTVRAPSPRRRSRCRCRRAGPVVAHPRPARAELLVAGQLERRGAGTPGSRRSRRRSSPASTLPIPRATAASRRLRSCCAAAPRPGRAPRSAATQVHDRAPS